jgi:hypothetical protein
MRTSAEGDEDRPYVNEGIICYHEAGHAVLLWHYGVRFDRVTLTPPADSGHWAQTLLPERPDIQDVDGLEKDMRVAAAGEIAERRPFLLKGVPADDELLRHFFRADAAAIEHPDHLINDHLIFANMGRKRDRKLREDAQDAATGPQSWVRVWREAEQLVRIDLWSAVHAVAEELRRRTRDLEFEEAAALATSALRE